MRYKEDKNIPTEFEIGEGLVGQCAFEKERIILIKCSERLYKNQFRSWQSKTVKPDHPSGIV